MHNNSPSLSIRKRQVARGSTAFYFRIPTYYRKLGCEMANEPLGTSYEAACGENGKGGRAATLNALFDEWNNQRMGAPGEQGKIARYGTLDWLFRQYKTEKAYTEKVSPRSRPDYERIMQVICDTVGNSGRRIGERQIMEVTPRAADKIYDKIINGPNGIRLRQGEKVVGLCRKVWRIMRRLHPELFDRSTRIPGTISPSRAAPKPRSMRSLEKRSINLHGAASKKGGLSPRLSR
jgi:hypothetical protein